LDDDKRHPSFLLEKQHKKSFLRQRDCLSGGEVLQYKHK